jgi:hypothetical protein
MKLLEVQLIPLDGEIQLAEIFAEAEQQAHTMLNEIPMRKPVRWNWFHRVHCLRIV